MQREMPMIRSSFIELLREKPVAKISVTELCERAGINRATFYAHYADPSDLLRSIEDEILNDLSRWLGPAIAAPAGPENSGGRLGVLRCLMYGPIKALSPRTGRR